MSWNPFDDRRARSLFAIAVAGLAGLAGVEAWRLSSDAGSAPPAEGTRVPDPPVETVRLPVDSPVRPEPRPRLPPVKSLAPAPPLGGKDDFAWLAALGSERMKALETRAERDGLWGSCLALGFYKECRRACEADPKGACVPKSERDACLDWREDERACAAYR
ncbi:MAG: hypothetical protein HY925_03375 [Elusimicrobia bacterium]|nr:hypothetical protein [Elusimicrobiota bacterium]